MKTSGYMSRQDWTVFSKVDEPVDSKVGDIVYCVVKEFTTITLPLTAVPASANCYLTTDGEGNFFWTDHVEVQQPKEDEHAGMVYNPYSDSWSYLWANIKLEI